MNFFSKKSNYKSGISKWGKRLLRSKKSKLPKNYFSIDIARTWSSQQALIVSIKLKRSNFNYIALIKYSGGAFSYIYLPNGVFLSDYINTQVYLYKFYNKTLLGYRVPLRALKKFTIFFNLSLFNKKLNCYAMSSGTFCSFLQIFKELNLVRIKLPSAKKYLVSGNSFVTLGRNSNIYKKYGIIGAAKFNLTRGRKPLVRGVAMNPVDHPHGGRTKTNSPELSIWGWIAKISH